MIFPATTAVYAALLALVYLGLGDPGSNYPCGNLVSNFGELMVSLPLFFKPATKVWNGPGQPSVFSVPILNDPIFVGRVFTWQAAIAQPGKVVLTDALDILIGDQ